jgi:hypothetical protein
MMFASKKSSDESTSSSSKKKGKQPEEPKRLIEEEEEPTQKSEGLYYPNGLPRKVNGLTRHYVYLKPPRVWWNPFTWFRRGPMVIDDDKRVSNVVYPVEPIYDKNGNRIDDPLMMISRNSTLGKMRPLARTRLFQENWNEAVLSGSKDKYYSSPPIRKMWLLPPTWYQGDSKLDINDDPFYIYKPDPVRPNTWLWPIMSIPWFTLLLIAMTVMTVLHLNWYRHQVFELGYCDTNQLPVPVIDEQSSKYFRANAVWGICLHILVVDFLSKWHAPACIPCPPHGICQNRELVECEVGFLRKDHPFGEYWPFSVYDVMLTAMYLLDDHDGQVECGQLDEGAGLNLTQLHTLTKDYLQNIGSDLPVDELWESVSQDLLTQTNHIKVEQRE